MDINIFAADNKERKVAVKRHVIALAIAVVINLVFWMTQSPEGGGISFLRELAGTVLETIILMEASFAASRLVVRAFLKKRYSFMSLVAQNIILLLSVVLIAAAVSIAYALLYPDFKWLTWDVFLCDVLVAYFLTSLFMTSFLTDRYMKEKAVAQQATIDKLKLKTDNHFVFNSLATLGNLIETDTQAASSFNASMSRMYRYIVSKGDSAVVPLSEELAFIEEYKNNLSLRRANVDIVIDNSLSCLDSFMPPLTLQGLVENAIKHNRHGSECRLVIHLEIDKDRGCIAVTNNRLPLQRSIESPGTGLGTLNARYMSISGRGVSIVQEDHEFKVLLPIIKQNEIRI